MNMSELKEYLDVLVHLEQLILLLSIFENEISNSFSILDALAKNIDGIIGGDYLCIKIIQTIQFHRI